MEMVTLWQGKVSVCFPARLIYEISFKLGTEGKRCLPSGRGRKLLCCWVCHDDDNAEAA